MTEAVGTPASSPWPFPWKSSGKLLWRRFGVTTLSVLGGLVLWHFAAARTSPLFLPSPEATWDAALELIEDGTLQGAIIASAGRIAAGWGLGVLFGIPLGIFMGRFDFVRRMLDPYIEFFRFIPPIAFVTLAVIWLGPGEWAKVSLILYTTVFIVTLNTIAGVHAVSALRLRAAASLGAGPMQTLWTVILPSTVPYMVTGARIAMGNSFLTVISAEIVAAQQGLGSLIWTARNFSRTEWVFVGIIALGLLGFVFDRVLRLGASLLQRRYGVKI